MTRKTDARVVVVLTEAFAKAVNKNGLQYSRSQKLSPLKKVLRDEKATLTNVMRDFEYYVQSSDAHGADESPIIAWSRDATTSDRAKAYYGAKFVVTLAAGTKVMPFKQAKAIAKKIAALKNQGVVQDVRVDAMDPAKNPPIPARYFGK
tara:strand:+ start:1630 stop:2076 length:447 start_codon:yes stop_codon:yes gene_type:complete